VPVVNENPEVVSAARQSRQANNTYPPVIDRSIGSPAGSPAPAVSQGPGSQSAPIPSAVEPVAEPNLAVPPAVSAGPGSAVGNPSVIDGGGAMQVPATANRGVIQVPTRPTQVPQSNSTVVTPTVPIAPIVSEEDYYQQGFDLLKQSRYVQAVDVFKEQIARYPNGGFADDAHYWVAESMYLNRSLAESKQYFRAIIDNFQQSPRLPDAMLKTAYIEQEQGNEIEARILLQEIIQYHPRSDAAISAKNRLEKLD
jgi:tol-pal system protein YbgF